MPGSSGRLAVDVVVADVVHVETEQVAGRVHVERLVRPVLIARRRRRRGRGAIRPSTSWRSATVELGQSDPGATARERRGLRVDTAWYVAGRAGEATADGIAGHVRRAP